MKIRSLAVIHRWLPAAIVLAPLALACSQAEEPSPETSEPAPPPAAAAEPAEGQTLPSGLIISEIVAGDGASPGATDVVQVHYHGTFPDGR
nr:hypothetical protein [Myxococcota bacterium]